VDPEPPRLEVCLYAQASEVVTFADPLPGVEDRRWLGICLNGGVLLAPHGETLSTLNPIARTAPVVMLMDIQLPGRDELAVLQQFRKSRKWSPSPRRP